MIRVNTFDLIVFFKGYDRTYYNISRTAVKYFIEWHQKNPDYEVYTVTEL